MASSSTQKPLNQQEMASAGGKARASKLTKEQRSAIARKGGSMKGKKGLPRASHVGELRIGSLIIPCAVVDGKRLISQTGVQQAFSKSKTGKRGRVAEDVKDFEDKEGLQLPAFIRYKSVIPFITSDLLKKCEIIKFIHPTSNRLTYGFDCELLTEVCELFLRARDADTLPANQKFLGPIADSLMRSFAKIGLISLIDERTGFQEEREKGELTKLLNKYIAEELQPWTKKFPVEFFKQIYKLYGWKWGQFKKNHPGCVGTFINNTIYNKLPPGVISELQELNPVTEQGYREHRHHQFLTDDVGNDHLTKQIMKVTTLMQVSKSKTQFNEMMDMIFPDDEHVLDI